MNEDSVVVILWQGLWLPLAYLGRSFLWIAVFMAFGPKRAAKNWDLTGIIDL